MSGVKVDEVEEKRREERRGRELCVLRPAHAFRDPGLNLSTFFSAYSHPQESLTHRATLLLDSSKSLAVRTFSDVPGLVSSLFFHRSQASAEAGRIDR